MALLRPRRPSFKFERPHRLVSMAAAISSVGTAIFRARVPPGIWTCLPGPPSAALLPPLAVGSVSGSVVSAGRRLRCRAESRMSAQGREAEPAAVRSVPVQVAHELVQAGHRYLDVRTPEEFGAGHPKGAVNVPVLLRSGGGMTKNAAFLEQVLQHFGKDDEIVVGCQSGKRSLMAAAELQAAEFTGVTDVSGGYSAWLQGGLPVE